MKVITSPARFFFVSLKLCFNFSPLQRGKKYGINLHSIKPECRISLCWWVQLSKPSAFTLVSPPGSDEYFKLPLQSDRDWILSRGKRTDECQSQCLPTVKFSSSHGQHHLDQLEKSEWSWKAIRLHSLALTPKGACLFNLVGWLIVSLRLSTFALISPYEGSDEGRETYQTIPNTAFCFRWLGERAKANEKTTFLLSDIWIWSLGILCGELPHTGKQNSCEHHRVIITRW